MFFKKKNRGKDLLEKFSEATECRFEALPDDIEPDEVMKIYVRELENGKAAGYTPVIVVADDVFYNLINDRIKGGGGAQNYNRAYLSTDVSDGEEVLRRRYENAFFPDESEEMPEDEPFDVPSVKSFIGISKEELFDGEKLLLVRLPTTEPWRIFAWIPFGGWNECPPDTEIMSVAKYWYDKYGAVPALLSRDTLQFYVAAPVTDGTVANELAKEQFSFSPDIVYQGGVGSIDTLARSILYSNVWFFWWD